YAHHGLNDFIICAGYKGSLITEYFVNLVLHHNAITVDLASNSINYHGGTRPNWRVTVVETGMHSMTGGLLGRIRDHLTPGEPFCMTAAAISMS
ncbi:glucose-1-phosphate cytidylyltransferase, partial [Rhizobium leguminosarum]